jgi:hypothetical protein
MTSRILCIKSSRLILISYVSKHGYESFASEAKVIPAFAAISSCYKIPFPLTAHPLRSIQRLLDSICFSSQLSKSVASISRSVSK